MPEIVCCENKAVEKDGLNLKELLDKISALHGDALCALDQIITFLTSGSPDRSPLEEVTCFAEALSTELAQAQQITESLGVIKRCLGIE